MIPVALFQRSPIRVLFWRTNTANIIGCESIGAALQIVKEVNWSFHHQTSCEAEMDFVRSLEEEQLFREMATPGLVYA